MALPGSESSDQLKRICGGCALAFLLCIIALMLLQARGLEGKLAAFLIILVALAVYGAVALSTSTANPLEFHIAGRRVSAAFAGIAAAAQWSAPVLLLAPPASLFVVGYEGRPMLIGLTGGYVLLAILIAPFVRNCGARTVPGFLAARFGTFAGGIAVAILLICSVSFMAALVAAGAAFVARVLAIDPRIALVIGMGIVLLCAVSGGMRSVIASQVAQYTVLLIGSLAVFFLLAAKPFDAPEQAPYDPLMQGIDILMQGVGLVPAPSPRSVPFHVMATLGNLEFITCLMTGTASLPHVIMHPLATAGMNDARRWAAWSLLFIAILVFALPSTVRIATSAAGLEPSGALTGLTAAIAASATVAAASGLLFTMAGTLAPRNRFDVAKVRMLLPRGLMIIIAAGVGYAVVTQTLEAASLLAWSFSLAAAGLFPALVLGIWWDRVSPAAAVLGMLSGFSVALFYLVMTRYFRQAAIGELGMTVLSDPANGRPLVDLTRILADPAWRADVPAALTNPLASKVGWLNVGNDACGIFGLAFGFAVTIVMSLMGKGPSAEQQERIEAIRIPGSGTPCSPS